MFFWNSLAFSMIQWPYRWQPIRLPRPWNSPGKKTGVGCHFLLQCMKVKSLSESEVVQSFLTLRDPMDCSPPGSSIHGIFQARVLEWCAIAFSEPTTSRVLFKSSHGCLQLDLTPQYFQWDQIACRLSPRATPLFTFFPSLIFSPSINPWGSASKEIKLRCFPLSWLSFC